MTPWLVYTCEGAETPIGAQPHSYLCFLLEVMGEGGSLPAGGVETSDDKKGDYTALPSNLIPPKKFGRMRKSSSPAFFEGAWFPSRGCPIEFLQRELSRED